MESTVTATVVKDLLLAGKTYKEISDELKQLYPGLARGLSVRSVRRFVKEKQLRQVANSMLKDALEEAVGEVSNLF
jgi:hypothetical protein